MPVTGWGVAPMTARILFAPGNISLFGWIRLLLPNQGIIIPHMGIISQGKLLLDSLFTRTQRQLLGLFFGHPERSYYLNEIVRLAGVGTGSVQRELARLSRSGLLTTRRVGNQKHYQANDKLPIFPELCQLVRKTLGVVEEVRSALHTLPGQFDLALLYLDPRDAPEPTLRLLLVSEVCDAARAGAGLAGLPDRLGQDVRPWVLNRARYRDLLIRRDGRLTGVLEGAKVVLEGSPDPENWRAAEGGPGTGA